MLDRMMFKDSSHPKAGEQVSFDSGKIGMFFDVYSYVSAARNVKDFKWDIAPLPEGSEGRYPMLGQAGYGLFKDSKHPEKKQKNFLNSLQVKRELQLLQHSSYRHGNPY